LTRDPLFDLKIKCGLGDLGVLRLASMLLLDFVVPRIDSEAPIIPVRNCKTSMMNRSNLLRGVGLHTFIVVHRVSDGGGVWHRRPASSSLRVSASRLLLVAVRQWIVFFSGTCRGGSDLVPVGEITEAIYCSSSSHSERLCDEDLWIVD
jgi:hypothetical protein